MATDGGGREGDVYEKFGIVLDVIIEEPIHDIPHVYVRGFIILDCTNNDNVRRCVVGVISVLERCQCRTSTSTCWGLYVNSPPGYPG